MFEEKLLKNLIQSGKISALDADTLSKTALEKHVSLIKLILEQKIVSYDFLFQMLAQQTELQ